MRNARKIATAVAATLLLAWVLYTLASLQLTDQQSRQDRASIRSEVGQLRAERAEADRKVGVLAEQLEGLGEAPVVEPDEPLPPNLRIITPAPSTVTISNLIDAAVPAALREACGGSCVPEDGEDGVSPPPTDPLPPLPALVPRDGVDGKDGADGKDGRDGADAPRITSFACAGFAPQTLTIGLSDGTTYTAECTLIDPVEPTPEPTSSEQ